MSSSWDVVGSKGKLRPEGVFGDDLFSEHEGPWQRLRVGGGGAAGNVPFARALKRRGKGQVKEFVPWMEKKQRARKGLLAGDVCQPPGHSQELVGWTKSKTTHPMAWGKRSLGRKGLR
ncbi:hypothetical protein MPNT_90048 [Candidatus Methylacidithermus pantelleriae]|uniref:Uncharacterized protein n=1 Tax=Candidatus Methylacidithermus pantelleriae TaxID=2744239 RepID=A0A8J2BRT2_9BACT|nr:hypothetical protein MPNT_90048 [Candidatus Methylacidithermus pantelleriae]